jgi:iron complex transport system substrate-binding protein
VRKKRIISLVPAATEFLCEMGLGHLVIGRSDSCDYPPDVEKLPVCSRSSIDSCAGSVAIHEQVSEVIKTKRALFTVDADKISSLKPDVVIVQQQCSICAVSPDTVADIAPLVQQLIYSPTKFAELWTEALRMGEELGYAEEARDALKALKTRVVDTLEKIGIPTARPRVLIIEWLDPLMTAGNWVPDMIAMAGGEALLCKAGANSHWVTADDILQSKPQKIILVPCGFGIEKTKAEFTSMLKNSPWNSLEAIKKGECYVVDGNEYFNRPGPRLVTSFEILAEILNPKLTKSYADNAFVKL